MLATLRQQFPSNLLAQLLQHVQMLVQLLGATANAGVFDLSQPLRPMTGIVDVPSRTRNRPATIQRFQTAHDPGQILNRGHITPDPFAQSAYARLAMVDGVE